MTDERRGILDRARELLNNRREPTPKSSSDETLPAGMLARFRHQMSNPDNLPRSARFMLSMIEKPLKDMVDAAASRLLSMDEAAAQLALFVEQAVETHGHDKVLPVVLRKNLMLDGTLLAFIEPILRGKDTIEASPKALAQGRSTLLRLLVEIIALDDDIAEPPEDMPADACLEWLELHGLAKTHPQILLAFGHDTPPSTLAHIILNSYMLFLQSFMMRSAVHLLGQLAGSEDDLPDDNPAIIDTSHVGDGDVTDV